MRPRLNDSRVPRRLFAARAPFRAFGAPPDNNLPAPPPAAPPHHPSRLTCRFLRRQLSAEFIERRLQFFQNNVGQVSYFQNVMFHLATYSRCKREKLHIFNLLFFFFFFKSVKFMLPICCNNFYFCIYLFIFIRFDVWTHN